jgi:hypothetical protein
MPTKTDRILGYLPGTFRTSPRPAVLYPVVDAFGNELLQAENSLSAVMMSHWVDFADKNAAAIDDLARIASLYGLAPRDDESVEEFREHLKRYVRTFLDGTVTVQGILRITAEVLGLHIQDSNKLLDSWWKRRPPELITVTSRGDDAAELLFGAGAITARATPALPAVIRGDRPVDGVDLGPQPHLYLTTDMLAAKDVALPGGTAALDEIVEAINNAAGATIARAERPHLALASTTLGGTSSLEILEGANDAALQLLGIAPRVYRGSEASAAVLTSTVDLNGGADLSVQRYVRLSVDGTLFAEVDCADPAATLTSLDHIRDAINAALGSPIASHDGHFLTLQSPTKGFRSIVAVERATAQDAAPRIFGKSTALATGQDTQPARATGSRDLSGGVDLSQAASIRLRINGSSQTISCAGVDRAHTQTIEIVTAINSAFNARVASPDGTAITITSGIQGAAGEVAFETPPQGDATEIIFGIRPRAARGAAETTAHIAGSPDLSQGVSLMALRHLSLAVDGGGPVDIDLQNGPADPQKAKLQEIAATINQATVAGVASDDGTHLQLTSPTPGPAGSLEIVPLETTSRRRFVTRAAITDEAAQAVLGFVSAEADGTSGASAQLIGDTDLSFGVDLREKRYLNVSVDGQPAVEFDCAGTRPRATLLKDVVDKINIALKAPIATTDARHLILTSPTVGAGSHIDLLPPRTPDALPTLLGVTPGTVRGQDATCVIFTGLVDLSNGLDLPANAAIKISIDGSAAQEITIGDAASAHKSLSDIAGAINQAMGSIVSPIGGNRLVLNSSTKGTGSKIEFLAPTGSDATALVFGITAPRSYHGDPEQPARVTGTQNLAGTVSLATSRFLRVSVDGAPTVEIDCASESADPASAKLEDVFKAINKALQEDVASAAGNRLVLTSPTSGFSSLISLEPFSGGDARQSLLGNAGPLAQGKDAAPAAITGTKALDGDLDLGQRRLLRIAINGAPPQDIDIAGKFPAQTTLSEVIGAINRVVPGMASITDDDHLRLVAPKTQAATHLSIRPLRFLEAIEYLPTTISNPPVQLACGGQWSVVNKGAAPGCAEIDLLAPLGTVSPGLINLTAEQSLRLLTHLGAGETALIRRCSRRGLRVWITSPDGTSRDVPGSQLLAGPIGSQAIVPFTGSWNLPGPSRTLQLNNPESSNVVIVRARLELDAGDIAVEVEEVDLSTLPTPTGTPDSSLQRLLGRVRIANNIASLVDALEHPIVRLRPGPGVDLAAHKDQVVAVSGPLYSTTPPLLLAQTASQLFDVKVNFTPAKGSPVSEAYSAVTIGAEDDSYSLLTQLTGDHPSVPASKLVKAGNFAKASVLQLAQGGSDWLYLDCDDSRYNYAHFNQDYFPNGLGHECGVFNVSHFAYAPPERVAAIFTSAAQPPEPSAELTFRWTIYQPGTFAVNLPVDLPARFGGRFNQTRFANAPASPELYAGAVSEPLSDPNFLTKLVSDRPSDLVTAQVVGPVVPQGFTAMTMPFRKPQFLTLGTESTRACLYLAEAGLDGLIEVRAREPGVWGNQIAVSARLSGPATYDVEISYQGARFENARAIVRGDPPPSSAVELAKPSPIGVLQAKAAGVLAQVTRDGADSPLQSGTNK